MPRKSKCRICGQPFDSAPEKMGHELVAHGPLVGGATRLKRKKVRDALATIHRRLEKVGFSEADAGYALGIIKDELRKAGLI